MKTKYKYSSQILVIIYILFELAYSHDVFEGNLNGNPYLTRYGKLDYNTQRLSERHARIRRSLDSHLHFTFTSHGREFKLKLTPTSKTMFANNEIELNGVKNGTMLSNLVSLYHGVLADEPDSSHVSGAVIDGVFYGTIDSKKSGKFHVESAKRYNHSLNCHTIIYNEADLNLNASSSSSAKTSKSKRSAHDHDIIGCGNENVRDWMKDQQKKLFDERNRLEGYDPFTYVDQNRFDDDHGIDSWSEKSKYTKEANTRRRHARDVEPVRLSFPDKRTMCNLYLRVDPILYKEIFSNEGNRNHDTTATFLLFYLNKHVEALNAIYNSLAFYDSSMAKYYVGLQFMIHRTKIITDTHCRSSPPSLKPAELKLCEQYLDVSTFLNYVSLDDFSDYCISYTFTARDFADGTLGLAWVAKLTGSVGGVCERRQTLQGVAKSLNSGIVTVVNYQARVPEAVSQITFAHEVGHNFGSEHDPDDSNCSPGAAKGGNYIMYRRATAGTEPNNRNFSSCSKNQMGPVMHALVQNPMKFCFKQYNGSLCGNGIVEAGEECDCGYKEDCTESCCHSASEEPSKQCKLKSFATCSPSQGPCCLSTCKHASSDTICMQSSECLHDVKCTGQDSYCPRNDSAFFKPMLSTCNSGTQVCKEGVCSGSICERYNMTQFYLEGNLKDKNQDKAILCHLACIGDRTNNECIDSFTIPEMINPATNSGFILKPGSPCTGTLGYCDIFSKCRAVDAEGPLARLKNLILNPVTLSKIRTWIMTYWWACVIIVIGLLVFMVVFIKVCSVHTPSSNPRKPPALKFSETLRRPMKRYHISSDFLHHHHHHHQKPTTSVTGHSEEPRSSQVDAARPGAKNSQSIYPRLAEMSENKTTKANQVLSSESTSNKKRTEIAKTRNTNKSMAKSSGEEELFLKIDPATVPNKVINRDERASKSRGGTKQTNVRKK